MKAKIEAMLEEEHKREMLARQTNRPTDIAIHYNIQRALEIILAEWEDPWQPIETAPKDGREVWVYADGREELPSFQCVCAYHPDAGWCADELREVTHWMPLPAPPQKEE